MHISILLMEQIIQLFLMIFMGFLIVKAKLLNSEDSKILSIIVLYLIIPCVIINAFQVDYTPQTVKGLLIALVGSVMTQVILLIVVSILGRVFHLNEVEVASIYYSNSGNLIVPIVTFILGKEWVLYGCVFMSVQLVFLPIDKPMEKCNMEKFVRDLINKLDFANKKASDCGYELIKFFDHNPSFYLSEFYKFITDMKNDNNVHPEDEQHFIVRPQMAEAVEENTEAPLQTTVVSTPSFKLAKEVKDYSGSDIGFDDDESDATSTTVLTNATKGKPGPVIVRTRTGERIKIDKPIFCIGKSAQGVDYQVTDNNSVSRRHAYIINVNGVYYLRDNKSTNHTYLGGKIINSGTDMMLIDGSKFKLANEEFTFREK